MNSQSIYLCYDFLSFINFMSEYCALTLNIPDVNIVHALTDRLVWRNWQTQRT